MNHKKRKQITAFNKFYREYVKCIDIEASKVGVEDDYEWLYIQQCSIEYLNWYRTQLPIRHVFWHFEASFQSMYNKCYYINNYGAIENILDLTLFLQEDLEMFIPEIKLGYKL